LGKWFAQGGWGSGLIRVVGEVVCLGCLGKWLAQGGWGSGLLRVHG